MFQYLTFPEYLVQSISLKAKGRQIYAQSEHFMASVMSLLMPLTSLTPLALMCEWIQNISYCLLGVLFVSKRKDHNRFLSILWFIHFLQNNGSRAHILYDPFYNKSATLWWKIEQLNAYGSFLYSLEILFKSKSNYICYIICHDIFISYFSSHIFKNFSLNSFFSAEDDLWQESEIRQFILKNCHRFSIKSAKSPILNSYCQPFTWVECLKHAVKHICGSSLPELAQCLFLVLWKSQQSQQSRHFRIGL